MLILKANGPPRAGLRSVIGLAAFCPGFWGTQLYSKLEFSHRRSQSITVILRILVLVCLCLCLPRGFFIVFVILFVLSIFPMTSMTFSQSCDIA